MKYVVCIIADGQYNRLTLGKVYKIISIESLDTKDSHYKMEDDNRDIEHFYTWRFKEIPRKMKLERILCK